MQFQVLKKKNLLHLSILNRLMKNQHAYIMCIILILLTCMITGCVAPPKESPLSQTSAGNPSGQSSSPSGNPVGVVTTSTTQSYLTAATPFQTPVTPTFESHTRPLPTPDLHDQICLISLSSFDASTNVTKIAKTFDLRNPPMYITYSLTNPDYVTGTKQSQSSTIDSVSYSELNPASYLEITVRNHTTGTVYTQDGFGKGYGQYLNKTIKVSKPDDMLIEFAGYKVTGTIGVWVKPFGNFEDNQTLVGTECKYAQDFGPNTLGALPTYPIYTG
jgi:hypothetical protein